MKIILTIYLGNNNNNMKIIETVTRRLHLFSFFFNLPHHGVEQSFLNT